MRIWQGLSLEDNFADIYGTKYGKEVIWTIHFEIYEKEAQYSQSLKPRDVFVEKAVNKDEIPYAKGGARSTYAPSPFLMQIRQISEPKTLISLQRMRTEMK